MSGIRFIEANPAIPAYEHAYDRTQKQNAMRAENDAASAYVQNQPAAVDPVARQRQSAIREISARPGGGAAALKVQQIDAQTSSKVDDEIFKGISDGTPDSLFRARRLAEQHGVEVPPEVWTDAKTRGWYKGFLSQMKSMGATSPEQLRGVVPQQPQAVSPEQAAVTALPSVPEKRTVSGTYVGADGNLGVIESTPYGGAKARGLGVKGTPAARAGGGGRGFEFQAKIQQYTKIGVPEDVATNLILGGQKVTPNDIARITNNLMKMKDANYEPLYPTVEAAQQAAIKMANELRAASAPAASGVIGAPTPTASPVQNVPMGMPPGSRYVGTSNGFPVYEAPDGQRYIEQ